MDIYLAFVFEVFGLIWVYFDIRSVKNVSLQIKTVQFKRCNLNAHV